MPAPAANVTPPEGVDYGRKWQAMVAVGLGIIMSTIDGSIVNVALPTLVDAFDTTFPVVQWVVLAYSLTLASLSLMVGRLGDMIGKKPIYTAGFVVFTSGSVLAGLSPTIGWLIGFRVLQALGAVMVLSLGLAIVAEAFPPWERGRALGIAGSLVSIGIVVGPTVGGLLIQTLDWRWIFYVNLPIGIVGTVAASRFVPAVRPRGGQTFDYPGAALLFFTLLCISLALTVGQTVGFADGRILLLFAGAVIGLFSFVMFELGRDQPMLDLRLFKQRLLSVSVGTGYLTFVAVAGSFILFPFYLQNVLGYEPGTVGVMLAGPSVAIALIAPISGSLSDRFGSRPMTVAGLAVLVVGYASLRTLGVDTSGIGFVLLTVPIGIGMGMFQSPNNSAIMGSVPPEQYGVASGLLSITRILGQVSGIALLGAFWAIRVAANSGREYRGAATTAGAGAQVAAFRDVMLVVAVAIALGLGAAIWGLAEERRSRQNDSRQNARRVPPDRSGTE